MEHKTIIILHNDDDNGDEIDFNKDYEMIMMTMIIIKL